MGRHEKEEGGCSAERVQARLLVVHYPLVLDGAERRTSSLMV